MPDRTPVLECKDLCISYFTRAGEIPEFTGISAPYEPPDTCELTVDTGEAGIDECMETLLDHVARHFPLAKC